MDISLVHKIAKQIVDTIKVDLSNCIVEAINQDKEGDLKKVVDDVMNNIFSKLEKSAPAKKQTSSKQETITDAEGRPIKCMARKKKTNENCNNNAKYHIARDDKKEYYCGVHYTSYSKAQPSPNHKPIKKQAKKAESSFEDKIKRKSEPLNQTKPYDEDDDVDEDGDGVQDDE